MKPGGNINEPWQQRDYSDTDYAGDNETPKIMTGYIVIINRAVIACHLQSQKKVTLFVIEAEYSELTEVCSEILFFCAVLLFMEVGVE